MLSTPRNTSSRWGHGSAAQPAGSGRSRRWCRRPERDRGPSTRTRRPSASRSRPSSPSSASASPPGRVTAARSAPSADSVCHAPVFTGVGSGQDPPLALVQWSRSSSSDTVSPVATGRSEPIGSLISAAASRHQFETRASGLSQSTQSARSGSSLARSLPRKPTLHARGHNGSQHQPECAADDPGTVVQE
jgi:hypothetical protein